MKQYERTIDELGRVSIPEEVRERFNLKAKCKVSISLLDGAIVINPHSGVCAICGKPISSNARYHFCDECLKTIKENGADIKAQVRSVTERCVDEFGRIVLPADFRRALNIGKTGSVILDASDGLIILKPAVHSCAHCGAIIPSDQKYRLCDKCVKKIRRESGSNVARVMHKQGRFYIDNISFTLPDNTYVSTVTEIEIENGMGIVSGDERAIVMIMGNDYAESAEESIESIFDSETNHEKIGEIEPVSIAGFAGYKVMYEDRKSINIECCLDVHNSDEVRTLTLWAQTDKQFGEDAVEDMKALFNEVVSDIRVMREGESA